MAKQLEVDFVYGFKEEFDRDMLGVTEFGIDAAFKVRCLVDISDFCGKSNSTDGDEIRSRTRIPKFSGGTQLDS